MQHLCKLSLSGLAGFHRFRDACQGQVRFFALHRIEPHAPPLVRAPVNSFEFQPCGRTPQADDLIDRKSTRLNSSHANISYAVFCLKKKKKKKKIITNHKHKNKNTQYA